jgi:DNA-binding PadR family transcriptional regulator
MVDGTNVQSNLPLTEVTFFILLSLVSKPKHGYAIMKDVHGLSQGRIMLSTGTLYGAIRRLLEQGWIARASDGGQMSGQTIHPGRPRKAYALTELGRRILNAEVERLQALIAVARLRTVEGQV